IGFLAVYAVTLLLAVVWLASNVRQIAPDSQAVVLRFGKIVNAQQAGLLLAWPRPIDEVRLLPGPDRQLSQVVTAPPDAGGVTAVSAEAGPSPTTSGTLPADASPYLTADGSVVLLNATLIFRIKDPEA